MSQLVDTLRTALSGLPPEWLWLILIFILPIVLLLLLKGLARISARPAGSRATPPADAARPHRAEPPTAQEDTGETQQEAAAPEKLRVAPAALPVTEVPTETLPEAPRRPSTVVPPRPAVKIAAETPPAAAPIEVPGEAPRPVSFFERLKAGLAKTRRFLSSDIDKLFDRRKKLDDDFLEDLEELLITADLGVETAMGLIEKISRRASRITSTDQLKAALKEEIVPIVGAGSRGQTEIAGAKPHVIMVVGVNGVGKTTTIGKLAARFSAEGKRVLVAAADTFRAAAVEQLTIWADRAGADIVKHRDNADPAAVAYDGVDAGIARGADIVLVDTAGRLHTKVNLMEELKKIKRTIGKRLPEAPHEILLVLDATTGQNALSQAKLFNEALEVTGLALTKLDGTAKGGIVVGICSSLKIPLTYIGVGEKIDDLQRFDPVQFADALF